MQPCDGAAFAQIFLPKENLFFDLRLDDFEFLCNRTANELELWYDGK